MTRHVLAAKAAAGRDEKGREVVVSQLPRCSACKLSSGNKWSCRKTFSADTFKCGSTYYSWQILVTGGGQKVVAKLLRCNMYTIHIGQQVGSGRGCQGVNVNDTGDSGNIYIYMCVSATTLCQHVNMHCIAYYATLGFADGHPARLLCFLGIPGGGDSANRWHFASGSDA